jgi:uncharacterized membrane protein
MHDLSLLFHLVGAFVLVAGITVAGVAFEAARRRQAPREVALLLALTRVGVLLVAVGTLLALGFGLLLVHLDGVGYGTGWVDASIALFLTALVLGAAGGRRPKQARKLAVAESGHAQSSAQLRALLDDPLARGLNYLSLALIVAIVVLMVTKPGAPG